MPEAPDVENPNDERQGEHMNTHARFLATIQLIGGCLFCFALAAIGLYPFADSHRGRDNALKVSARRGLKSLIPS